MYEIKHRDFSATSFTGGALTCGAEEVVAFDSQERDQHGQRF